MGKLHAAFVALALQSAAVLAEVVPVAKLDACPGYRARNIHATGNSLTADLELAGKACNVFGEDITKLKLEVNYETNTRLHVKITDAANKRFEVPESVLPRPRASSSATSKNSGLVFDYKASPFSFTISRKSAPNKPLFSTADHPLIFEPQYIRLKTSLPASPNIYGLGEHTDPFRLPTHNYTRTLWTRDAYGVPTGTNLYSSHPIYFEHRPEGTHGVFMVNANGMDVKIDDSHGQTLEYNMIGGVIDMYFLAGGQDPVEVSKQYAEIVGKPAEVPYWGFGFHQCRFGYRDFVDVAQVITDYAAAGIPLETMWTDIDYMDRRLIFTTDPKYFPVPRVREIVDHLHKNGQKYILMTDPAVGYKPNENYGTFDRGTQLDVWLKRTNGSDFLGLVWPGVVVYPDWFHPKVEGFWTGEFEKFYNPQTGVDIDGVWIDMNEPASFCNFPCEDPFNQAVQQNLPPPRTYPPPNPNAPIFQSSSVSKRAMDDEELLFPPYAIENAAGGVSNKTAHTNVKHYNGLMEYDTHNLYGTLMSTYTQKAMAARRPGRRTLIITRSTFAGAGASVGKWLGDNLSTWDHYRQSIAGMLGMASVYQIPMVGSDICGFGGNTTETLCARWAMLGAFNPFMRNHNGDTSISQEFYRWPTTAQAARNAINIRYRLLDYIYTTFHQQHVDGTPLLSPLFFKYPKDANTFPIDLQFFYGPSILVSPVTKENATSVDIYLPKDTFYDFYTSAPVQGKGKTVALSNVNMTTIPLHIKGGSVIPFRVESAMTTNELRKKNFEIVIAPDANGKASGALYIDDGESVVVDKSIEISFAYSHGRLSAKGKFTYDADVKIASAKFLGVSKAPKQASVNGKKVETASSKHDSTSQTLVVQLDVDLTQEFTVEFS